MMPIALPSASSAERSRLLSADLIRRRALERLYERKAAVEDLIRSLEDYQRSKEPVRAECIPFSAVRKYSSGFAQSQI
jgi:hypothetical protein